jgi:hypothetical protein
VKTLYQKLIKIDILLCHVKLNKKSMVTSPSKHFFLKNIHAKKSGLNRENRKQIF